MKSRQSIFGALAAALYGALAFFPPVAATAQDAPAAADPAPRADGVILTLDGPVTPASAQYLAREIDRASTAKKDLVVIEIDTPGGLVDSMKTIIKAMLASDTPIATYVSPQGARSASAGLYIMYAAQISAMAPNTNTGAATPVELGGGSGESPLKGDEPETPDKVAQPEPASGGEDAQPADDIRDKAPETLRDAPRQPLANDEAMRAKVINDSVAYIRALAEERGRNADWAEKAVREAASVTSREALKLGVIDYVADDLDDLMRQIDGKTVTTAAGEKILHTANISFERIEPTFIEKLLGFIANPNVAVILMSLATTGIIIEMWNPGSIFPGAVGILCLLLGLYAFQVLPFSWLGAALMMTGALLMVVEAFTPTFGLVGLIGLLVFGGGLYIIFPEGYRVSPLVITGVLATAGGFLALVLFAVVGSRSHGPMIGAEAIRRREGVVDDWNGKEGWVIVEGERWRARSDKPLSKGDKIKVVEIDGLVLVVRSAKAASLLSGLQPRQV
ncbi:MAG: nodulation protein NfeD [Parvularculaceae bacterium]